MMIPRRREDCEDCKYDDTKEKIGLGGEERTGRIANMILPRRSED